MDTQNRKFRISAAQAAPIYLNKERTIEKAIGIVKESAVNGAQIVVFPEVFVPGYPDWVWLVPNSRSKDLNKLYSELVRNAVTIGDESVKKLYKAAKDNNIYIVIGINEVNGESSNTTLYNSLLFINEKGEVDGVHRKLMPTGGERLVWGQGAGDTLNVYKSESGRVGGLICWENFMPLARQRLYDSGIQIHAAPTWDKSDNWVMSMRHVAREGGMFVISCCQALKTEDIPDSLEFKSLYPEGREWINRGNSCIINPMGEIIAGPLVEKEEILYADIDLDEIISAKRMFDVSGHYSRPDVFKFSLYSDKKT